MGKRFRLQFAELYDGVNDDGRPRFDEDRLTISDEAERQRIAQALRGGTNVIASFATEPDVLAPDNTSVDLEISYSTDGFFVWRTEMAHYVAKYGLEPDFEFYAHIRKCNYELQAPELTEQLTTEVFEMMEDRN